MLGHKVNVCLLSPLSGYAAKYSMISIGRLRFQDDVFECNLSKYYVCFSVVYASKAK